jgi:hypothetical protein
MKKNVFLFLFLICWHLFSLSQIQPKTDPIYKPKLTGELFVEKKYKGSQYATSEWANSIIVLCTGDTVWGEKIKYNGYLDEVIWLHSKNFNKFKLDKSTISEFWIKTSDSLTIHYKQMSIPTILDNEKIFIETLCEGNLSLYIHRKINQQGVSEENEEGTHYELEILEPDNTYFFKLPTGQWIGMHKLDMNHFLKAMPDQKQAIIQLAKKYHLKFKSENQCIKLIQLINKEILITNK